MPQSNPRATVVIPTYNRVRILPRAVKSVLNQTFGDFEVIIVDDASTDDTEAVVRSLGDSRISYLRQGVNQGGGAARDRGIDAARGAYVAFLDSDDEWFPEFLERIDDVFTADHAGEVGVVETGIYRTDGSVRLFDGEDVYERLLAFERHICLSSIAVRREALEPDLRFLNPTRFAQDRHLFMEVARNYRFVSIPEPLARLHGDSGNQVNSAVTQLAKRQHFFSLHCDELKARPRALARHHGALGTIHVRLGDHRSARVEFRSAIRAWPRDARWSVWWGVTWFGRASNHVVDAAKAASRVARGVVARWTRSPSSGRSDAAETSAQ